MTSADTHRTALVTGATGYIGGALVPALLDAGLVGARPHPQPRRPRGPAVARRRRGRRGRRHLPRRPRSRRSTGREVAYYLLHSMDGQGRASSQRDRTMAQGFAAAAADAGTEPDRLPQRAAPPRRAVRAPRLPRRGRRDLPRRPRAGRGAAGRGRARRRLGVLRHAAPPHRAAARHGRAQVGRQPHPADRGRRRRALPRAARPTCRPTTNRTFDIGGPEVLTYAEMMQRYAEVAGIGRRLIVSVPVLTPRLAGSVGRPRHPDLGRASPAPSSAASSTRRSATRTTPSPRSVRRPAG